MPRSVRSPSESAFYRELGNRLRIARSSSGKSQSEIAEHLDLSFQQIQKYEKGIDRIPVYALISLADYLEAPLSQIIAPSPRDSGFQSLAMKFDSHEFHALLEAWGTIKNRPFRAGLMHLVTLMAENGQ